MMSLPGACVVVSAAVLAADGGAAQQHRPVPSLLAPMPRARRETAARENYVLRPANDGSEDLVYDGGTFTAHVADDGTVRFKDHHVTDLNFLSLAPRRARLGVPSLQSSLQALLRRQSPPAVALPEEGRPPPGTMELIPETSRFRSDPREACRECNDIKFKLLPVNITGRFDLTDELMRMNGADPYRIEKAKFLVATREQRVGMALRKHASNVRRAAVDLPAMVASIACDDRLSRADRLAILAALRDDMDLTTEQGRDGARAIDEAIDRHFRSADAGAACSSR